MQDNKKSKYKIVAVGGGTGLSTLLRGLKAYDVDITAVVTVSDDGGSSGKLRKELGVLPPGDIRNCLVALAEEENLITKLFQYRFPRKGGLSNHSFGNLFLTALTSVSGGFDKAADPGIAESPIVLGADEYFVLGDNRNNSEDSRSGNIGPVSKSLIEGRAWFKLTMNDSYMGFIDRGVD